jgi:radical SAM protein with 4Fe4S-binding SPASM domain
MLDTEDGYLLRPTQLPGVVDFIAAHQERPFPISPTDDIGYYTEREAVLRRFDCDHFPYWVGCFAGILIVAIESNGGVKGCPSLDSSLVEGNIRERPLRQIWYDERSFAYNRAWDGRRLRGYCRRCCYRNLCRAGCTSFAIATTGTHYENRHCLHRVEQLGELP